MSAADSSGRRVASRQDGLLDADEVAARRQAAQAINEDLTAASTANALTAAAGASYPDGPEYEMGGERCNDDEDDGDGGHGRAQGEGEGEGWGDQNDALAPNVSFHGSAKLMLDICEEHYALVSRRAETARARMNMRCVVDQEYQDAGDVVKESVKWVRMPDDRFIGDARLRCVEALLHEIDERGEWILRARTRPCPPFRPSLHHSGDAFFWRALLAIM